MDFVNYDTNPDEKENYRSTISIPIIDHAMAAKGWAGAAKSGKATARPFTTKDSFLDNLRSAEGAIESRGDKAAAFTLKNILGKAQPGMKRSLLQQLLPKGEDLASLNLSAPPEQGVEDSAPEDSAKQGRGLTKGRTSGVFVRKNR